MNAWKKWFTEWPNSLLLMGPTFLILAGSWAYFAHSINVSMDLPALFYTQSDTSAEDQADSVRIWRLYFSHPWISLFAGLVWGTVFGLWGQRRTLRHMDIRVEQLCNEARGRRLVALFTPMPGMLIFSAFLLILVVLAIFIPIAAKPLMFSAAGAALVAAYPAERIAWRRADARLSADPMDDRTRRRVDKWRRRRRMIPTLMAIMLIVTIVLCGMLVRLAGEFARLHAE